MDKFFELLLSKKVVGPIITIVISVIVYRVVKTLINKIFGFKGKRVDENKTKMIRELINNVIKYFIVIMSFFKNHDMLFVAPNENFSRMEDEFCNYVINRDVNGLTQFLKRAKHIYVTERSIYTTINTFTLDNVNQEEKDSTRRRTSK